MKQKQTTIFLGTSWSAFCLWRVTLYTAHKIKFYIKISSLNADMVTFTEETLNGKLHFCAVLFNRYAELIKFYKGIFLHFIAVRS